MASVAPPEFLPPHSEWAVQLVRQMLVLISKDDADAAVRCAVAAIMDRDADTTLLRVPLRDLGIAERTIRKLVRQGVVSAHDLDLCVRGEMDWPMQVSFVERLSLRQSLRAFVLRLAAQTKHEIQPEHQPTGAAGAENS